jgi:hypothetical protein
MVVDQGLMRRVAYLAVFVIARHPQEARVFTATLALFGHCLS